MLRRALCRWPSASSPWPASPRPDPHPPDRLHRARRQSSSRPLAAAEAAVPGIEVAWVRVIPPASSPPVWMAENARTRAPTSFGGFAFSLQLMGGARRCWSPPRPQGAEALRPNLRSDPQPDDLDRDGRLRGRHLLQHHCRREAALTCRCPTTSPSLARSRLPRPGGDAQPELLGHRLPHRRRLDRRPWVRRRAWDYMTRPRTTTSKPTPTLRLSAPCTNAARAANTGLASRSTCAAVDAEATKGAPLEIIVPIRRCRL